jgi:proline racemase
MSAQRRFDVIDSHTGGNPTRLVMSGIPDIPGRTMAEKVSYFAAHHDWIRTTMVSEPRGGNLTSSAVLVPPCDPSADIGVFFMEALGYPPMCGTDTIGLTTMLIETGHISVHGDTGTVRIDTPAGLVTATARIADGKVADVTFANVTAFVAAADTTIAVDGFGTVTADVAYGGNFYVIADARQFGVTLDSANTAPAVAAARRLLAAANRSVPVTHPIDKAIAGITHVQFFAPASGPHADARIMVIIEPGIVDRSPCGTGTTAKVATLMHRGLMSPGDTFVHESITGQTLTGTARGFTQLGDVTGYEISITGQAYITAESIIVVDPRDPLGHGFVVT